MRISKDQYYAFIATAVSIRGTCYQRKVGCVLINKEGHILSTGYNGPAVSLPHCTVEQPCIWENNSPGCGLDTCEAIHAEQNALLQCRDPREIEVCYVTLSPCIHCLKLLLNTRCKAIYFLEEYTKDPNPKRLWLKAGRTWSQVKRPNLNQLML